MEKDNNIIQKSLTCYDNNDPGIQHFRLALERSLENLPEMPLPEGYTFVTYEPGDKDIWIEIEKSAKEVATREEGLNAWERYFGPYEDLLPGRMYFVVNSSGEKVGTATAFFDVRTGDDHENGMLHWVSVRRDEQGKGLSKPLILHALHRMKELGYRRAAIPTQTNTWLACKVYLDLGFMPIPQNAENSRTGWRIIKTLTGHPALKEFEPIEEIEKSISRSCDAGKI